MGKIVRYCKLKEEHEGANCFDVSRPNLFGNPYTHIKNKETKALVTVKNRDEAIDLYDAYFDRMLLVDERFREEWNRMYEAYVEYGVVYIGCYCNENERCHGDIIAKKLKQRALKEMVRKVRKDV